MKGETTGYGFNWGPVEVERSCHDEAKGWVVLTLRTKRHPNGVLVYVTKTGKVRVHSESREWLPS